MLTRPSAESFCKKLASIEQAGNKLGQVKISCHFEFFTVMKHVTYQKNTVCHWNKNHSQYTEDALACDRRQIVAPTSTSDYPATPTSMYLAERKFQAGQASSRNLVRLLVSERLMASSDNDGRGWCLIITHTLRNLAEFAVCLVRLPELVFAHAEPSDDWLCCCTQTILFSQWRHHKIRGTNAKPFIERESFNWITGVTMQNH